MTLTGHDKKKMLRRMLEIRRFEEKVIELNSMGLIGGAAHCYIGEEAIAVGVCRALNKDDMLTSTHRGHGHCIAKGANVHRMMAELLGRTTGYCRGKGGSMHIADFGIGILGANGIVGGGLSLAVGAALSASVRESKQVVVCFFGDGAANQGIAHEAMNVAALWKLPVIFVCENNGFAVSTRSSDSSAVTQIADRAAAYGMPGAVVDGNDVIAVYRAADKVVKRARKGMGPALVECMTYRWEGHYIGDPCLYRSRQEVALRKEECAILRLKKRLIRGGVLTERAYTRLDAEVTREMEKAQQFAIESPHPEPHELMEGVYSQS